MKFVPVLALMSAVISASAFAGDKIRNKLAEEPSATPFQVLEQFYNQAKTPAELNDFTTLEESNQHKCVIAFPTENELHTGNPLRRLQLNGTPSNGPLFPGRPGKVILVLGKDTFAKAQVEDFVNRCSAELTAKVKVQTTRTELVQESAKSNCSEPMTVKIRKDSGLIVYRFITETGAGYGYCYKE